MIVKNKSYGDNGVFIFADGGVHPNPTTGTSRVAVYLAELPDHLPEWNHGWLY